MIAATSSSKQATIPVVRLELLLSSLSIAQLAEIAADLRFAFRSFGHWLRARVDSIHRQPMKKHMFLHLTSLPVIPSKLDVCLIYAAVKGGSSKPESP